VQPNPLAVGSEGDQTIDERTCPDLQFSRGSAQLFQLLAAIGIDFADLYYSQPRDRYALSFSAAIEK